MQARHQDGRPSASPGPSSSAGPEAAWQQRHSLPALRPLGSPHFRSGAAIKFLRDAAVGLPSA
eukprot:14167159-Alexandrium_andersonii.AAC.1